MSSNDLVRIGLIGTGWIGSHHGHNVAKNPHAALAAIADPADVKARELLDAEGISAPVFSDAEQMLASPDIDAVIVASPNAMHAQHAIAAAQDGKHIYLEKPMAITPADCRAVAMAVQKAGVKCAMGYHRRFNPLAQYAKTLQLEGNLGDIVLAESEYVHFVPGDWAIWEWLGKESIAGSLIHAGTGHNIDLLRYFGGEISEVSCFKDIRMPRK
ncbi:MAG: Gfo/Idh/MocA family oxidoreductase, partial [Armatimonadota bacterium]